MSLRKTAHILTGWPNPIGVFKQGASIDTKLKLGMLVNADFTLPSASADDAAAAAPLIAKDIFVLLNSVGDADTSPASTGDADNVTIVTTGTLTAFKLTDDVTMLTKNYTGTIVKDDYLYQDSDGILNKAILDDNTHGDQVCYLRCLEAPQLIGQDTFIKVGAVRGGGYWIADA